MTVAKRPFGELEGPSEPDGPIGSRKQLKAVDVAGCCVLLLNGREIHKGCLEAKVSPPAVATPVPDSTSPLLETTAIFATLTFLPCAQCTYHIRTVDENSSWTALFVRDVLELSFDEWCVSVPIPSCASALGVLDEFNQVGWIAPLCGTVRRVCDHATDAAVIEAEVDVHLRLSALKNSNGYYMPPWKKTSLFSSLLDHCYPHPKQTSESEFFGRLGPSEYPAYHQILQPSQLKTTLLEYQKRSVSWMLDRENVVLLRAQHNDELIVATRDTSQDVPMLWRRIATPRGNVLWVSIALREITERRPLEVRRGGILADEMGLGKTVMVLSLIMTHTPTSLPGEFKTRFEEQQQSRQQGEEKCLVCGGNEEEDIEPDWVACDTCNGWFHLGCVGLSSAVADEARTFVCRECESALRLGQPRFKGNTLIVCPASIFQQWVTEIKTHTDALTCVAYEGCHATTLTVAELVKYDIVLTTYEVLRKEVHSADPPRTRARRSGVDYRPAHKRSSLVQVEWWRVVLDEAQMVENAGTNASKMASKLHRELSWAVTGTPVKSSWTDVYELIRFLRLNDVTRNAWDTVKSYGMMAEVLQCFVHRNTKKSVKGELVLPPQRQRTVMLTLSRVERTWYSQLVEQMMLDVGVDLDDLAKLSSWLLQLRQTCCHPQIGSHNRTLLGGTLRSMRDVLDVMYQKARGDVYACERRAALLAIRKAMVGEFKGKAAGWVCAGRDVLNIYEKVKRDVELNLEEIRKEMSEIEEQRKLIEGEASQPARSAENKFDDLLDNADTTLHLPRLGDADTLQSVKDMQQNLTSRYHSFQEVLHRSVYFMAGTHHLLKQCTHLNFEEHDKLETQYYEAAESLRRDMLHPFLEDIEKVRGSFMHFEEEAEVVLGNGVEVNLTGVEVGITGKSLVQRARDVVSLLNKQWELYARWRKGVIDALVWPVGGDESNDHETEKGPVEGGEPMANSNEEAPNEEQEQGSALEKIWDADKHTKDEYAKSRALQDKADFFIGWLNEAIQDRRQLLIGVKLEGSRRAKNLAALDIEPAVRQIQSLLDECALPKGAKSLRELISDLKKATGKSHSAMEERLLANAANVLNKVLTHQLKAFGMLEKEKFAMNTFFNTRTKYFVQLQKISDGVDFIAEPEDVQREIEDIEAQERALQTELAQLLGKRRYLATLVNEEKQKRAGEDGIGELGKECLICRDPVKEGKLTQCGHLYCKGCFGWVVRHNKCAMCNQRANGRTATPVFFGPNGVKKSSHQNGSSTEPTNTIALRLSDEEMAQNRELLLELNRIPIVGSYGTKLDYIIRHLKYLRLQDRTCKTLIFSQWEQVLSILSHGLQQNNISHVKLTGAKKTAAQQFTTDPDIEVIMLNARSQAAGLTLVAANHVILVEPIVNGALEAQAVHRIWRIGQTRETYVWKWVVGETIEERVALLGQRDKWRVGQATGDSDEEEEVGVMGARNVKIGKGSAGEVVDGEDVKWCLFGDVAVTSEGDQRSLSSEREPTTFPNGAVESPASQNSSVSDEGFNVSASVSPAQPTSSFPDQGAGVDFDHGATDLWDSLRQLYEEPCRSAETGMGDVQYVSRRGRGMAGRKRRRLE
ncbi:SNF2 family N-terminal domain-containing protein [Gaertneriomyces semiglobifer]|nr:SNF2 family N-terminal domain-containing protein [Gaertneriomyces semiglobifer]